MKRKLFVILFAIMASIGMLQAEVYSGTCGDNLQWSLNTVDSTLTITGSGAMYDYNNSSPWFHKRSFIKSIQLPEGLTTIGDTAFSFCSSLTSVNIPNSVATIGNYAFYNCESLASISIPYSVTEIGREAFAFCSSLTSVNIPNSITEISNATFAGCASLTLVNIPNSVTTIGEQAFSDCPSLTSITIPNSVTTIGWSAFYLVPNIVYSGSAIDKNNTNWDAKSLNGYVDGYLVYRDATKTNLLACSAQAIGEITIPNSVSKISSFAFAFCSSLISVIIPNSVTIIEWSAFRGCSSLTSITIPNSVTTISSDAFMGCTSLTSITIPNSVTTISAGAFDWCISLTSITIPNSVERIGSVAFRGCENLASLNIPNSVTWIGDKAFYDVPHIVYSGSASGAPWGAKSMNGFVEGFLVYRDATKTDLLVCLKQAMGEISIPNSVRTIGDSAFIRCTSLTSVNIPNSVTTIGNYAFYGCESLTSVSIPNSVTTIGNNAFCSCPLTTVSIPNSVTTISAGEFDNCRSLTSVIIPNTITMIGSYAFCWCSSLTSITCETTTPPIIGNDAFYGVPKNKVIVYVPANSVEAYKNAEGWKEFTIKPFTEGEVYSGQCGDNLWWSLNTVDSTLTITGSGAMYDYNYDHYDGSSRTPWYSKHSYIKSVHLPEGLTTIGNYAFFPCTFLTSVNIPNSVTTIGAYAFDACSSLTSINIPSSVTTIDTGAFYFCLALTSVNIPNSVTTIGEWAFYYVPNIVYSGTAIGAPWGARNFNGYVDGNLIYRDATKQELLACSKKATGKIIIPNSVTTIRDYAFYSCSDLTSITIPNSVTKIGNSAFESCFSLTSINIPNSVTTIGNEAFEDCSSLSSITIPNSITKIDTNAFNACSSLTSVTIPNSVTTIAKGAFNKCSSLTSVAIPNSVTTIESEAFKSCTSLISITIPNSVTKIDSGTFFNCSSLTSVSIPNSIKTINYRAFILCKSLTSITIPDGVTYIGNSAFALCNNLTSVTIPKSVTTIEKWAFINDTSLTTIICEAPTPPTLGEDVFLDESVSPAMPTPPSATLYVPANSVEAYKNADGWKDFANIAPIYELREKYDTIRCGQYEYTWYPYEEHPDWYRTLHYYSYSYNNYDNYMVGENDFYDIMKSVTGYDSIISHLHLTVLSDPEYPEYRNYPDTIVSSYGKFIWERAHDYYGWISDTIILTEPETYLYDTLRSLVCGCDSIIYIWHVIVKGERPHPHNPGNYQLTLYADPDTVGTVSGAGLFAQGTKVEISATPKEGYHFVDWSDGNTSAQRTITIEKDTALTAHFEINYYTILFVNQYGFVRDTLQISEWKYDTLPEYYGAEPTRPDESKYSYTFAGWDPAITKVKGDTTYVARYDTIFLGEDTVWVYYRADIDTLPVGRKTHIIVDKYGYLNVSKPTTVASLTVHADTICGQVKGIEKLTVTSADMVLRNLSADSIALRWFAFAVPFEVSVAQGIYIEGTTSSAVADRDFFLDEYDGALRASTQNGWKAVTNSATLYPGYLYMIAATSIIDTWRFVAKSPARFSTGDSIKVRAYPSTLGDHHAGWNGIANPLLLDTCAYMSNGIYATKYNNYWGVYDVERLDASFIVANAPFFVQVPDYDYVIFARKSNPSHVKPMRMEISTDKDATYRLELTSQNGSYTDKAYMTTSANKENRYTIGRDLEKMQIGATTVPQLWIKQYGMRLAVHEAQSNSEVSIPLGLYAPNAGKYIFNIKDAPSNAKVFLAYQEEEICNLSESAAILDLNQGDNEDYRLVIRYSVGTDIINVEDDSQNESVRKILLDGQIYIVRDGKMYTITGAAL